MKVATGVDKRLWLGLLLALADLSLLYPRCTWAGERRQERHDLKSQVSSLKPQPRRGELRGFWADGFDEGYKTPQQIDLLLQRLRQAHCNAIFAQMRKGGDAYYASHYEPWASDDQSHFDALACLIRKAHALNPPIAVHAWLNVCAVGRNRYRLPGHIATLHPEWLSLNTRLEATDPEVAKIDLGDPDAADWTVRTFLDVVRHYDVDGIHLDFVRYSGKRRGYNAANLARFERRYRGDRTIRRLPDSGLPAPDDPAWKQWRRDQVTAFVRKLYAFSAQIDPKIVVSAALIAWEDGPHTEAEWVQKSAAMNLVFQDWRSWLQEGILDLGCPMTYFPTKSKRGLKYQQDWAEWIKDHQYGRAATVGIGNWENTIPETLKLLSISRRPSAAGHRPYGVMLYSYAGTNESAPDAAGRRRELKLQPEFYAMLGQPSAYASSPPFPADAPIPPMSWKDHPARGHLKGFVLTPQLEPVDGALVEVRSSRGAVYRQRTDGTGFYAFIDLPAGKGTDTGGRERAASEAAGALLRDSREPASSVPTASPSYLYRVSRTRIKAKAIPESYTACVISPDGSAQQKVSIAAGQMITASFTLGRSSIPLIASVAALPSPLKPQLSSLKSASPVRLDNLLVTLGSDTFPGNLYVMDAEGAGIRVRLASAPVLPFQLGDVVSVIGTPGNVDGEPALDQAFARLTDIAPMAALPAPITTSARLLAAGKIGVGRTAQIAGVVVASNEDGFTLEDHRASVVVPLAGRKEFGIESTSLQVDPPAVGSQVRVTGIVSRAILSDGHISLVRLLPLSGADVVVLSAGAPLVRSSWGRLFVLLALFVGIGIGFWIRRRNYRR